MRAFLNKYPICSHVIMLPADTIPLHVNILGYGYEQPVTHDYYWNGRKRGKSPFTIWQYTVSGKGMVSLQGKEHPVPPGTAMLVEVPQDHHYFIPKDSDHWEFIWINLVGHEAMRIWRKLTSITGPVASLPKSSSSVKTAQKIMRTAGGNKVQNPYDNSLLGYLFLMQLVQEILPAARNKTMPDFIHKVTTYCMENMTKPLSVDDLATEAGFSKYHFNRIFKEFQGTTPMAFLTQLRISHALRLLQTTRLTIKEIAGRCGFEDPSYFCKVFRKHHQTSPGEFRTQVN